MKLTFYGHTSFKIVTKKGFVIYLDPSEGEEYEQKADLILISHEGYHHLNYEVVRQIRTDTTEIYSTKQVAYETNGNAMNSGDTKEIGEVKIKAIHAYSTIDGFGKNKGEALGFLISIEGKILYFAGSTDLIPEMEEIVCDIALFPVALSTTITPRRAAEAIDIIKPKIVIPMHYGVHGGHLDEVELFKEIVEEKTHSKVDILEPGKEIEF